MSYSQADELRRQADLAESKARWCDAHGFPHDADQHRWFAGYCRRQAAEIEDKGRAADGTKTTT